jgi:dTMP kinase
MPQDPGHSLEDLLRRGLLIAAEGLDSSGKTATLDGLARWLERRGRNVRTIPWEPSGLVGRAAADPRLRTALTPRVAALLAAADAQHRIGTRVSRRLGQGDIVLADRYAWTAIAREVARGLGLDWSVDLHRTLPAPDIVLYHRGDAGSAVERALATRPPSVRSAAVGAAYGTFVERLLGAYDALAERTRNGSRTPWSTQVVVLDVRDAPSVNARLARDAVRPLVDAAAPGGRA